MRYERLADDTSLIVGENGESQLVSSSLNTNRQVCSIRKILVYLLLIQLIICAILLTAGAILSIKEKDENYPQRISSLLPICLCMIYYICGLIFIYRNHHLGIYVFAWLGILSYLLLCAEVFLKTLNIIKHPAHDQRMKTNFRIGLFIAILSTVEIVLLVITLKITFRLLNLIKIYKHEVLEQI